MITNQNLLEAIKEKSSEKAVKYVFDFINQFNSQRVIRDSGVLRLDDFYSGRYTLSKLISGEKESDSALHLYDEEKWCRGCQYNCDRVSHNIKLALLSDRRAEEIVRESLNSEYPLMHALSRNLLLGLNGGFSTLLDTYHGREFNNLIKESAQLHESDFYCYVTEIPYTDAMNIVRGFRYIHKKEARVI